MIEAIQGASPGAFLFSSLATAATILGALYLFQRSLKRARLMEDLPTSRIRSAAQGYLELEGRGKMMPGEPIAAPLSQRPCLWWKYKISERSRDSRGRSRMRTIDSGESDALFLLSDGTGECIIDPDGASIIHTSKHVWHGRSARPQGGVHHNVFGLFARYRYEEWLISPSDPIYAIGHFRTQSAVVGHFDEQAELNELIREWKQDQTLLHQRFDINKDGRIDNTEWEAARRVALKQVRRDLIQQNLPPGLHVLSRPLDGRPFLISGISQTKLIRRYRFLTIASLCSFLGFIAALVWAIGIRSTAL